jgi:hypothetical protein
MFSPEHSIFVTGSFNVTLHMNNPSNHMISKKSMQFNNRKLLPLLGTRFFYDFNDLLKAERQEYGVINYISAVSNATHCLQLISRFCDKNLLHNINHSSSLCQVCVLSNLIKLTIHNVPSHLCLINIESYGIQLMQNSFSTKSQYQPNGLTHDYLV